MHFQKKEKEKKDNGPKHRQNSRGISGSVCFPPEPGRLIHLSGR
jgi:hypothetical protein